MSFMLYKQLLLKSVYVKWFIPAVGLIVMMVLAPDFIDKAVAPELATSENSIFVVLIVGVFALVCATRVDNAIVDGSGYQVLLRIQFGMCVRLCVLACYQVCCIYLLS